MNFFRNNLLGMFLFAVAAGIVANIVYQWPMEHMNSEWLKKLIANIISASRDRSLDQQPSALTVCIPFSLVESPTNPLTAAQRAHLRKMLRHPESVARQAATPNPESNPRYFTEQGRFIRIIIPHIGKTYTRRYDVEDEKPQCPAYYETFTMNISKTNPLLRKT